MRIKKQEIKISYQPILSRLRKHKSEYFILLYCLLIGLCAAAPLWGPGIVNTRGGGDSPFLLQRTLDMAENIKDGAFPPRWMAHAAYDYGYPFFNHYGALPYYISGGLTLIGIPVIPAIQSTQTLGFVLAACTMALWTKQLYKNHWAVILSVAAYTFTPFHLVNVYVRGDSLSEFYAFVWFPLILWALQRYLSHRSWSNLLIAAGAYGGLVLTHNTSTVAFSPFALLYAVFLIFKNHGIPRINSPLTFLKRYIAPLILPFILGMLLTAWFWLPALAETGYGQLGPDFTEGYFHHSQHYRGLNLVQSSIAFDYDVALQAADAGPFSMGLIQTALTVCGVCILFLSNAKRLDVWLKIYLLISLLLATFIMTPLSSFLWDYIPLLGIMQFPWRFLAVQAVYTASITAVIPSICLKNRNVSNKFAKWIPWTARILAVGIILLVSSSALLQLHPDRLRINSKDITWDMLGLYETFTGNIGTTIRHEYLPMDVVPRPYITEAILDEEIRPKADGLVDMQVRLIERKSNKQRWEIDIAHIARVPDKLTTIVFPLYWWPGWQVTMDGIGLSSYAFPGSGQLAVDIAEGHHDIVLYLQPTKLQLIALLISCVTLVLTCIPWIKGFRASRNHNVVLQWWSLINLLIFITIPLVLPSLWHHQYDDTGMYFDFDQMPYPHAGPIDFRSAILKYSNISVDTAFPGDEIDITMHWSQQTAEPLTAVLRLVSPAEHRHNVSYTLMETEVKISPNVTAKLQLPGKISRGLYLVQLRVYEYPLELKAITPQGHGMGPLYIGAVRVQEGTVSTASQEPLAIFKDLNLHEAQVYQTEPNLLYLNLVWTTPGTPRNWSLSLRLLDISGQQMTQRDTQPGYGFLPTSLWHQDEYIYDYYQLDLPEGLAPGNYQVRIISYLQATGEVGGDITIPFRIDKPTLYDLRDACCEQTRKGATILCQYAGIALLGVDSPDVISQGQDLSLTAEWNAVRPPQTDIVVRWALVNSDNIPVSIEERPLAADSNTSSWPLHAWILNPVHLALDPLLPSGSYQLHLTMHDDIATGKQCLIREIDVNARTRVYAVSSIPHQQQVVFNDEIKLLGFDTKVIRTQELVELTLWWQAEKIPQMDYKRFVHIFDPQENVIMAQDDAMPREWTYPTTWWDKGEIVSETISLSIKDIPKGIYYLGTGWYNPETLTRLGITSSDNEQIEDGQVTLISPLNVR